MTNIDKNQSTEISPEITTLLKKIRTQPCENVWMELNKNNIDENIYEVFYNFDSEFETYLRSQRKKILKKFSSTITDAIKRGVTDKIPYTYRFYASDCYYLLGDYENAIAVLPKPSLDSRWSLIGNRILSLRYYTNTIFETTELLMLFGVKVTRFSIDNLQEIVNYIDELLPKGENRTQLLNSWVPSCNHAKYLILNGHVLGYHATKLSKHQQFYFSDNPIVEKFVKDIIRNAENHFRVGIGLPRVGEGWVSETKLFYEIKQNFSGIEVIQHASPEWLGKQHLDIYIPELNIALEYQGTQHDQPINHFGGENSFIETKKRDLRKLRLCRRHGIRLIYVRDGYNLEELLLEIKDFVG